MLGECTPTIRVLCRLKNGFRAAAGEIAKMKMKTKGWLARGKDGDEIGLRWLYGKMQQLG